MTGLESNLIVWPSVFMFAALITAAIKYIVYALDAESAEAPDGD